MLVPPKIMKLATLADNESSRYALGGVRFERDEAGTPFAIATDGRRLARVTWSEGAADDYPPAAGFNLEHVLGFETVLPAQDCTDAAKLPPKRTPKPILENVVLDESANGTITYGATDLARTRCIETRSLEGRYPRWRDVARDPSRVVRFDKSGALAADIPGATTDSGDESAEVAPVEIASGDYAEICLDPKYLADLCKLAMDIACGDDSRGVTFQIPLNQSGAIRLVKKYNGVDFLGILMPLATDK